MTAQTEKRSAPYAPVEPQPLPVPDSTAKRAPDVPATPARPALLELQTITRQTRWRVALLVVAALAAIAIGVYVAGTSHRLPVGLIQANGRIESDVVNVSSKLSGRITSLAAREGDTVNAGKLLIQLDDRS